LRASLRATAAAWLGIARRISIRRGPAAPVLRLLVGAAALAALSAPAHAQKPQITSVTPAPAPAGGIMTINGTNLTGEYLSILLVAQNPSAPVSSYQLRRHIVSQTPTAVQVKLLGAGADVAHGSYTLKYEVLTNSGKSIGSTEFPLVVGAPTKLGPPTITKITPAVPRAGMDLWIQGTNFPPDLKATLVATPEYAAAGTHTLTRNPAYSADLNSIHFLLPEKMFPARYFLQLNNPAGGTALMEVTVATKEGTLPQPPTNKTPIEPISATGKTRLMIQQNVDKTEARPGEKITYSLLFTGSGERSKNLVIRAWAPAGTTFDHTSIKDGKVERDGDRSVVTWRYPLAPAGGQVGYSVFVDPDAVPGRVVAFEYRMDADGGVSATKPEFAKVRTTRIAPRPINLVVGQVAPSAAPASGIITYTIFYGNDSNEDAQNVYMEARIPANCQVLDVQGSKANGGAIGWNLGTLKAGQAGMTRYRVKVNAKPGDTVLDGGCFIRAGGVAPVTASPLATTVTTGEPKKDFLSVLKRVLTLNLLEPPAGPMPQNIVAVGGGNVITIAGASIIAVGGNNVIAIGPEQALRTGTAASSSVSPGQIIAVGGNNIIAVGGNNVRTPVKADTLVRAANLVGLNGSNLVGLNGSNLVGLNGSNVVALGGNNLNAANVNRVVALGGANVINPQTAGVIALGGANLNPAEIASIVALGGANIISRDGAGIIAVGGMNLKGSGIVALGGMNLLNLNGGTFIPMPGKGAGVVAMGGANVIVVGGNIVAVGGGNIIAPGGGN
jgi:hypothetical protein